MTEEEHNLDSIKPLQPEVMPPLKTEKPVLVPKEEHRLPEPDVELKSKDAIPLLKEFLKGESLKILTGELGGAGMWIRVIILTLILLSLLL